VHLNIQCKEHLHHAIIFGPSCRHVNQLKKLPKMSTVYRVAATIEAILGILLACPPLWC